MFARLFSYQQQAQDNSLYTSLQGEIMPRPRKPQPTSNNKYKQMGKGKAKRNRTEQSALPTSREEAEQRQGLTDTEAQIISHQDNPRGLQTPNPEASTTQTTHIEDSEPTAPSGDTLATTTTFQHPPLTGQQLLTEYKEHYLQDTELPSGTIPSDTASRTQSPEPQSDHATNIQHQHAQLMQICVNLTIQLQRDSAAYTNLQAKNQMLLRKLSELSQKLEQAERKREELEDTSYTRGDKTNPPLQSQLASLISVTEALAHKNEALEKENGRLRHDLFLAQCFALDLTEENRDLTRQLDQTHLSPRSAFLRDPQSMQNGHILYQRLSGESDSSYAGSSEDEAESSSPSPQPSPHSQLFSAAKRPDSATQHADRDDWEEVTAPH